MLKRLWMLVIGLVASWLAVAPGGATAAEVRISMAADPATVEPVTASELNAFIIYSHLYEALVEIAPDGTLVPALAERWEIFPERNAIRFHLRKGVRFHTGNPLTAAAVKGTYEILLAPKTRAGIMGLWAGAIAGGAAYKAGKATELTGVAIIDDYTVEVTLEQPNSVFIAYPIQIVDPAAYRSGDAAWFLKGSAGTGPFRFSNWQRGSEIRLVANADYWGGKPKLDALRYVIVPDQNTALSMYRTGELNLMPLASSMYRQVLGDATLKAQISSARATTVSFLSMNAERYEPFRDPRVRGAVCLSLDQVELKEGLYHGLAEIMDGPVPPAVPGSDRSLPPLRIDAIRARALLAEAGFPGGKGLPPLTLTMTEAN